MTIKAHFDGKVIVPDEPVDLAVGQRVRVVLDAGDPESTDAGTAAVTARRLAQSAPWAGRTDIPDSDEYARQLREQAQRRERHDPAGH